MRTLEIDAEIETKLSSGGSKLWLAAHEDGSDNRINNTCGALEEMLLEYIQAAKEGITADRESLDELIDTLEEIHGYYQEGKLIIPGKKELSEIRKSIAAYTAAMTGNDAGRPAPEDTAPNADEFLLIRDQLLKQKQWSGKEEQSP